MLKEEARVYIFQVFVDMFYVDSAQNRHTKIRTQNHYGVWLKVKQSETI